MSVLIAALSFSGCKHSKDTCVSLANDFRTITDAPEHRLCARTSDCQVLPGPCVMGLGVACYLPFHKDFDAEPLELLQLDWQDSCLNSRAGLASDAAVFAADAEGDAQDDAGDSGAQVGTCQCPAEPTAVECFLGECRLQSL